MTRFLTVEEAISIHQRVIQRSGGASGIRDRSVLEASVTQPQMIFSDTELYPSPIDKAAALAFFIEIPNKNERKTWIELK